MSDGNQEALPLVRAGTSAPVGGRSGAEAALDLLGLGTGSPEATAEPKGWLSLTRRLLLRYKWTIMGIFVLVAGTALAGIWTLITPEYQAAAALQLRSHIPRLISRTEETGQIPTRQYEQYLASQVAIMQSTAVLQRVLGRDDVRQTQWYVQPPRPLDRLLGRTAEPLARLQTSLSVEPIRRTELITVSMQACVPQDAEVIANAFLDEYLRFSREQFSEEDRQLLEELERDEQELRANISFSQRVVAAARRELHTGSPDELIAQRWLRLDQLEAEVDDLTFQIKTREQQLGMTAAAAEKTQPTGDENASSTVDYRQDAEWRRLHSEWQAAQGAVELDRTRFGPRSDRLRQSQQAAVSARRILDEYQGWLDELAHAGVPLTSAEPARGLGRANPQTIRSEIEQFTFLKQMKQSYANGLRERFEQEFNRAESLHTHNDDLQRYTEKLQTVLNRREELLEKSRVPASIRTVGRAILPSKPYQDRRMKLSGAAVLAALAAGVACAYLRLVCGAQVQGAEEVKLAVHGAFLGRLPLRRGADTLADTSPLQTEAVRMVRTALLNRLGDAAGHVVQITSAGPGSGKSTLSILLGRSAALSGKRVLLVDADVRRPALAQHFAIEKGPGLLDLMANENAEAAGIHPTATSGLSVICAGGLSRREDVELLANGTLATLLGRWRKRYDLVLMDSAPLLGTADAAILSRQVDGTIMVVRQRHCRRGALVEALAVLGAAGGKLLGTVFVGSEHGSTYGYGYGYSYGYEAEPQSAEPQTHSAEQPEAQQEGKWPPLHS